MSPERPQGAGPAHEAHLGHDADGGAQGSIAAWHRTDDRELAVTPIFTLRQHTAVSPGRPDAPANFVYLDSPDWVNVIAVTDDEHVVLIEQFRHGSGEVTLEIPGGMVDPGEAPLEAGLRELREETGFAGGDAQLIGSVTPNPAILNNRCYTVLVRGTVVVGEPALDGNEEIVTRLVPLARVGRLISAGEIHHALVVAAFQHLWLLEAG